MPPTVRLASVEDLASPSTTRERMKAAGLLTLGVLAAAAVSGCLSRPESEHRPCDDPWGKRECLNVCDPEYAADPDRQLPGPNEVVAGKYCFTPDGLTIQAGESVTFVNDDVAHVITVRRILDEESDQWEQYAGHNLLYRTNRTWTLRFDEPGNYFVMCSFHAGGTIRDGREIHGGMVMPDGIRVLPAG